MRIKIGRRHTCVLHRDVAALDYAFDDRETKLRIRESPMGAKRGPMGTQTLEGDL
jgi:hypothetical protein